MRDSIAVVEPPAGSARMTRMDPTAAAELDHLRGEVAHLRRGNQEPLATGAGLRSPVEKPEGPLHRLGGLGFGRRSERVTGPTLFDDLPDPEPLPITDAPPVPESPPDSATPRRRGHGRRPLPADLPRERVEIDLTDAEK